jgi:hypothetical protein
MLKKIATYPSHQITIGDSFIAALHVITKHEAKAHEIDQDEIPNNLILDNTIPTLDFYMTLGTRDNMRIRIMILERINSKKSNIPKRGKKIIGAVVFDFGNVQPMMYFGISRQSDHIEIYDEICWYKFNTLRSVKNVKAEKGMPTAEYVKNILKCWYAIEHVMLYPELNDQHMRYMGIIDRARLFTAENCYDAWPDPIEYKDSYNKDGSPRTYRPKTAVWHKRGHNRLVPKTGEIKFIQEQWCVRHDGKDVPISMVLSPFTDSFTDLMNLEGSDESENDE